MRWSPILTIVGAILFMIGACNPYVEQAPDVPAKAPFSEKMLEEPGGIPAAEVPQTSKWYQAVKSTQAATAHISIRQKKERLALYLPGHPKWQPYCTGTLVAQEGSVAYIVTANSMIEGMHVEIQAQFSSKRPYLCQLVGQDRSTNLALLKVEMDAPENLTRLSYDPSYTPQAGEEILTMGSLQGRPFSVMTGTVSNSSMVSQLTKVPSNAVNACVVINATFPGGSTGGPVVNQQGKWIGIVGVSNMAEMGSAIPASIVHRTFSDLKEHGTVHRAMLGVCVQNVYVSGNAIQVGIPADLKGVAIHKVWKDGAAAGAGLQKGDLITAINDKPVENTAQFLEKTFTNDAQALKITYYRGSHEHTISVQPQLQKQRNWLQKLFGT